MRVLILGESDSLGLVMPDRSMGWGNVLTAQLPGFLGEAVEVEHVRFYSWGANSMAYLESILERGPFDAVVISATKGGFTIFSAHNRIRRLMGRRAGDWFQNQADAYDRSARWRKPPGIKKSVNRAAHRVTKRVIGQEPPTTWDVVAEGYTRAFSRLAMLEDAHVVVVCAPGLPGFAARRRPNLVATIEQFRTAIRNEARRRRFSFVDPESLVPAAGPERDAMFIDDIHKSVDYQALLASAVGHAIVGVLGGSTAHRT